MSKPINSSTEVAGYPPPSQPENKKKPLNFWQNVFVGSLSGISAVALIQPMIYFKNVSQANVLQQNKPTRFEKSPRIWYRGAGGFAASFAPTIAIQTVANGVFSTQWSPFFSASMAGIVSAVVVCPAEGLMIQQQMTGKSFWETAKHVYSTCGLRGFYRAFLPTAIREGAFTAAYLGGAPILKEKMQSLGVNEWAAQLIAGTIAGTLAATVSHPFDTFKTQKQRDFSMKMPMIKSLFKKTAFAGWTWRMGMIITATIVMPYVQEKANGTIERSKK